MTYTPNDIVEELSQEGIKMRPKKVRRIMRGLFPERKSPMWELNPKEYKTCLQEIKQKVKDKERS